MSGEQIARGSVEILKTSLFEIDFDGVWQRVDYHSACISYYVSIFFNFLGGELTSSLPDDA